MNNNYNVSLSLLKIGNILDKHKLYKSASIITKIAELNLLNDPWEKDPEYKHFTNSVSKFDYNSEKEHSTIEDVSNIIRYALTTEEFGFNEVMPIISDYVDNKLNKILSGGKYPHATAKQISSEIKEKIEPAFHNYKRKIQSIIKITNDDKYSIYPIINHYLKIAVHIINNNIY